MVDSESIEVFVPGRICLFGEHTDWAGSYRRFNSDVVAGCALVCGTSQGLYARAKRILKRSLIYRAPDGSTYEFDLNDMASLREAALSSSYASYVAGVLIEIGKHFRVSGAEITNYKMDLPIKKGLSSSAAACVLVVRALNQLYDLKLTVHGEMDMAYRGEINTPSRCGRLDQCCAFGQQVTKMSFDGDQIATETVRVAAPLYLVVVDLRSHKDTKEILKCLNSVYPFPKEDKDVALHELLGKTNLEVCEEVMRVLRTERNPDVSAEQIGSLMTQAQARWDESAVPICPHELRAPTLHRLLDAPELTPFITGGKGVGSQGDGSGQLVCKSEAAQEEVLSIVTRLGMEPFRLTIPASKKVRSAIVPVAGFCPLMWPATKCIGPWLFPIARGLVVKPAICWLCEELVDAGIERIILVVNEATEAQMRHLFCEREDFDSLSGVPLEMAAYDEELLAIGSRLIFVRQSRPTGISDAVRLCEEACEEDAFLLAFGDHLSTPSPDGKSCVAQLVDAFDGARSMAALQCITVETAASTGVFECREPPFVVPGPSSPKTRDLSESRIWPLSRVVEKPSADFVAEHLTGPGLPPGHCLGSFGNYILTPKIFDILRKQPQLHMTAAIDDLRQSDGLDGILINGNRWDLGNTRTYIEALQYQL